MKTSFILKDRSSHDDIGIPLIKLDTGKILYMINEDEIKNDIRKKLKKAKIVNVDDNTVDNMLKKSLNPRREMEFDDCGEIKLIPFINENDENIQRDVVLVSGRSGYGKSTMLKNYGSIFNDLFPESTIYYISSKPLDDSPCRCLKNINVIDIKNIELDPSNPYTSFINRDENDKIIESLVLMDDIEGMENKINKKVVSIMNSIATTGRSSKIYLVVSRHIVNDKDNTKCIGYECTKFILFPTGNIDRSLSYTLNKFDVFSKDKTEEEKKKIYKFICGDKSKNIPPPRFVIINNSKDRYMISNRGLMQY